MSYRYWLSLPEGYRPGSGTKWPVIMFLHGSGECGDDLNAVLRQGIPKLLAAVKPPTDDRAGEATKLLREQFIVVSPQCPENTGWNDDAVLALLDDVLGHDDGDPKRVYLTGLSLGGYATWTLGLRYPERFAAIVPIAGGGSLGDVYGSNRSAGLPIWAFHGAQDGVVPFDESQRMVNALNDDLGAAEVKLTIYPDAEHDAWTLYLHRPQPLPLAALASPVGSLARSYICLSDAIRRGADGSIITGPAQLDWSSRPFSRSGSRNADVGA